MDTRGRCPIISIGFSIRDTRERTPIGGEQAEVDEAFLETNIGNIRYSDLILTRDLKGFEQVALGLLPPLRTSRTSSALNSGVKVLRFVIRYSFQ